MNYPVVSARDYLTIRLMEVATENVVVSKVFLGYLIIPRLLNLHMQIKKSLEDGHVEYNHEDDRLPKPSLLGMGYGGTPSQWERRVSTDGSFTGFFPVGDNCHVSLDPGGLRTPGVVESPNENDKLLLETMASPSYRFSASCVNSQGEQTRFTPEEDNASRESTWMTWFFPCLCR